MIRAIKRALAGLAAGLAIQPVARASSTEPPEKIWQAPDEILKEMDVMCYRADRGSSASYVGPTVSVELQREYLSKALPKWRNACFTASEETEAFVSDRTR